MAKLDSIGGCGSNDRIIDAKLALGHRNATVNRTLELVRAILRKCVNDWEWLDDLKLQTTNPAKAGSV